MKRFGATAVPMPLSEMLTSLQSGVIDGTMSGISIYTNFNLHTIGTVLTETQDTMLVCIALFSKKWLDTLPPDLKTMVTTEARALQDFRQQAGPCRERDAGGKMGRARRQDHHVLGCGHDGAEETPRTLLATMSPRPTPTPMPSTCVRRR